MNSRTDRRTVTAAYPSRRAVPALEAVEHRGLTSGNPHVDQQVAIPWSQVEGEERAALRLARDQVPDPGLDLLARGQVQPQPTWPAPVDPAQRRSEQRVDSATRKDCSAIGSVHAAGARISIVATSVVMQCPQSPGHSAAV